MKWRDEQGNFHLTSTGHGTVMAYKERNELHLNTESLSGKVKKTKIIWRLVVLSGYIVLKNNQNNKHYKQLEPFLPLKRILNL